MNEAQQDRIPYRPKVIIPEGADKLQEELGTIIEGLPTTTRNPKGISELQLGELTRVWPTSEGPSFVGAIPAYRDSDKGLVYVPRFILDKVTSCLPVGEENTPLPPHIQILD